MQRKKRFRWSGKTERSVAEIVIEDGVMRQRDVIYIIKKLCSLPDSPVSGGDTGWKMFIHPENVMVNIHGDIRTGETVHPLSALEPYMPPELAQTDPSAQGARVYALGMLMLYMATGKATKADMNIESVSRVLRSLIERSTAFDPRERFPDTKALLAAIRREAGKKAMSILSVISLICLAAVLVFFFGRAGQSQGGAAGEKTGYRSGFSEGFEQGFSDAPGIGLNTASLNAHNGNLSGNFSAEGGPFAVCGEDGVYYLTGENLCRMDPYTKETEIMAVVSDAYALQYYNGWLYYCAEEGVFRMDVKTAEAEIVCESPGMQLYIFDDGFYLYDSAGTGYLYRIDTEKGALIQLNGATAYHCLNIVNGQLYYISPDRENCLCRSDLDGGSLSVISSGTYESMCVYDGSIYAATEDGMVRMDLNGGNPESILSRAVYDPNVSDGGIFYISGQGRTLEWMSLDDKTRYTVVTARTGSFNVAGQWIFYRNEDDGGRLWRVRIGGSDNTRVTQ